MNACWGIDPSTQRVSIAWVTDGGERGVQTRSFDPLLRDGERLWHIYAETWDLCKQIHASRPARFVWVEQPFAFGKPVPPVSYMAMGAIMIAARRVTAAPVEPCAPPGRWKKLALGPGYGNAKKEQIMVWARERGYDGNLQDEADALGIAVAARALTLPVVP
jgi:Holliday junction resolvasome RuvABC endonuclease subunit